MSSLGQPPARVAANADSGLKARAMGLLYLAGATIGLISLLLPHPAADNTGGLYSNVVLAFVGGALVLTVGRAAPAWFFHVALLAGSMLVTRAVFLSHESVSFYAVWYVWIGLYAFYFFDRVGAALQVTFVAALYAITLAHQTPSSAVARWLTTVSTLVVAGVFIDTLVRRAHQQAALAAQSASSMATVAQIAHDLSALSDGPGAREALCRAAGQAAGADLVVLWEPGPDGVGLTATGLAGPAPWQTTVVFVGPSSGASRAFTTAAAVQADGREIAAGLAPELGDRLPAETCLWQPVMQHGSAVGVLAFYWSERGALARSSVQTVIDLLMAEAAVTLQRIELLDRLGAIARTDDLTGLPNRRAWNEDLTREIARAQREQAPLCVAILDLDHFKAFNDTHGHQAGDLLLKQAAARWNAELRATDLLARYGGEEFALALPGVSPETAEEIIDRLRRATPQDESCSAGAVWWDGAESPSELLGRADAALYAAKGAGRARTVFA